MSVERALFRNPHGLKLVGKLHRPEEDGDAIIIMAHGLAGTKEEHGGFLKIAERFNNNGLAALRFDFSGSGESDPTDISVSKQVEDLKSALSYVEEGGYRNIGILGHSLGGLCALLAYEPRVKSIVTHGAPIKPQLPKAVASEKAQTDFEKRGFTILETDSGSRIRIDKAYATERETLQPERFLSLVRCPVLLIHGSSDERVTPDNSKDALAYLTPESRVEIISGKGHDFLDQIEETISLSVEWFSKHVK